jgi:hypothetical protein
VKSKKAEQLKAAIEAEEAARQRELDAARQAEEEEEQRQQEEEAKLFATQQELLRAEEERKKRREAEAAKAAQLREELIRSKREERKKGADIRQEDLDALMDDEAELNALLGATRSSSMPGGAVPRKEGPEVVRESRLVRDVNPDELDDSYLEDEERGLLAFLARRTEVGFVRDSSATALPVAAAGSAPAPKSTDSGEHLTGFLLF